jgi:hypothetical protein
LPRIARLVQLYLRRPISGVRVRRSAVLGAAVPEAPVYENGDPRHREDDVRSEQTVSVHTHRMVDAEPQPHAVEL